MTEFDLALLVLRVVVGGLLAGHGAQKLFGWFDGPGLEGTAGMMGSLGLRPARGWALLAGLAEFGGGLLTLLGLLDPLGPVALIAAMTMAIATVHWGKPIWNTAGGAELPITNIAVAAALILAGPGSVSLDEALKTGLPGWIALPALVIAFVVIAIGLTGRGVPRSVSAGASG